MFVIMHPHLKHVTLQASVVAELLHSLFVIFLNPPIQSLRQSQHLILLLLTELRPVPLPRPTAATAAAHVLLLRPPSAS